MKRDHGARTVCGLQPVREAVRVRGPGLERVLLDARGGATLDALGRFATDRGVRAIERVPRAALDQLARGATHQGAIAVAPPLELLDLADLLQEATVVVALDRIQDPQNFGAVIRSSVVLGAGGVLWPEHGAAPLSPATFRASAGAIEHARLCRVGSLRSALHEASERGFSVVGLDAGGEPLRSIDLRGPVTLVVGGEHEGLRRGTRGACTHLARVAERSHVDSLNASVAAALALYEISRQRAISDS